MKFALLFIAIVLIALAVIAVVAKQRANTPGASREQPKKKRLLSEREEAMFNRLTGALPNKRVLVQVSFGALLTAKSRPARNTFDRKIADFVICDFAMNVIAVVELDDASHRSKEEQDKLRDSLLSNAGYRVLRYKNIPDIDQLQSDFTEQTINTRSTPC